MKKQLLTTASLVLFLSFTSFRISDQYVYICKGPYSERYHLKKDCSGLRNCSTDVYKVTIEEARKLDRTLCKLED